MRIFLVRHGESLGNIDRSVHKHMPDHAISLSDKGIKQAVKAGYKLLDYQNKLFDLCSFGHEDNPLIFPARLWTSPYKRTRQTADEIQEVLKHKMIDRREHILLCEQQFGLFDGIPTKDLPDVYPNEHKHYNKCEKFGGRFWARMPLGESRFDVATRVHQAFGTFHRDREKHGIENLIVVCHGVTMRAFVMMWCHKSPEWFEAEKNPKNCAIRLIEDNEDKGYIYEGES